MHALDLPRGEERELVSVVIIVSYLAASESADEKLVSPVGIEPARDEPKASCGVPDANRGEANPSSAKPSGGW